MANEQKSGATAKKMSLIEKLKALANVKLAFTDVTATKDRDGNFIAILTLQNPIPHVTGSQTVQIGDKTFNLAANDVRQIKVHQEDMVDFDPATGEGFSFDTEGTSGAYQGSDLVLDVSQQKEVWLKRTSFAQAGRAYKSQAKTKQLEKLFGGGTPSSTEGTGGPVETA